jgi:sigma-B regulation protein RsbU (phosphoserine phosphatase)
MSTGDVQLTAPDILRAFQHDAPYFFLGAAFVTIGVVAIGLCVLRRKYDALLVWLGVFAALYGVRMWVQSELWQIGPQSNLLLSRLPAVINCLIPIPAFTFFRVAGFLGETGKRSKASWGSNVLFLGTAMATLILGPWRPFGDINTIAVSVLLWIMLVRSLKRREGDWEFKVVRAGVLFFLIFALWDRTLGAPNETNVEPYGFAVLLACLGYVAARRTLKRDVELGEIQKELELAKDIQLSILPSAFPDSADFRVAARYVPMTSVAGDLYDYLPLAERQAGLFIADVSGHGVPAALIASMVKMAAISQRANAGRPAELLTGMNRALCGNTRGQFITAAYVHLDAERRELRYAAAGHPAMLVLRDGVVTEVAENGLILAAWDGSTYGELVLPLKAGDRLLLYTDGLVEARNAEGKMLGDAALIAALRETGAMAPEGAADSLIRTAQQWASSQEDDLTVVVCDFMKAEEWAEVGAR